MIGLSAILGYEHHLCSNAHSCRYEKYVPDSIGGKKELGAKGAFEEYYVELIDQINSLNLVSPMRL